jgi:deoxyribonucleoside regulator
MSAVADVESILSIARLRWEHRLSQVEIARRLGVSEATISRALKRAFDLGLVEVRIAPQAMRQTLLEQHVAAVFGLRTAVVVADQQDPAAIRRVLGEAMARQLDGLIEHGAVIGVSDGETTAVATAATRTRASEVQVVPLIGGVGAPEQSSHPAEVCRALALGPGARAWTLPLPATVDAAATAEALLAQRSVRDVLAMMRRLSIALVGVGATEGDAAIVRHGVISREDMEAMARRGAVGTICARFYDGSGTPLRSPLDRRTLAITRADLCRASIRIAIAFGPAKLAALRAAIAGGWVNGIGTDATTAEALLAARLGAAQERRNG